MTNNDRWWESYLVRYLAGNIFAVLILFYLIAFHGNSIQQRVCPVNSKISLCESGNFSEEIFGFIFITSKAIQSKNNNQTIVTDSDFKSNKNYDSHTIDITEINLSNIFILGIFGFLYMYISSIPIYFLHITRGALTGSQLKLLVFGFLYILVWFLWILAWLAAEDFLYLGQQTIFLNLVSMLTLGIILLLSKAIDETLPNIFKYLKKSTLKRDIVLNIQKETESQSKIILSPLKKYCLEYSEFSPEYITSYKHMREHGNAFSVILTEILFAWLLIQFNFSIYFIVFWLCLGSFGWFLGTYLEFKMVKSN